MASCQCQTLSPAHVARISANDPWPFLPCRNLKSETWSVEPYRSHGGGGRVCKTGETWRLQDACCPPDRCEQTWAESLSAMWESECPCVSRGYRDLWIPSGETRMVRVALGMLDIGSILCFVGTSDGGEERQCCQCVGRGRVRLICFPLACRRPLKST